MSSVGDPEGIITNPDSKPSKKKEEVYKKVYINGIQQDSRLR
jgi:hypothetical protein